jgi:hypothetical protein
MSEELKKEAITEFRKLWASINKENQHLTTEKIEDLIVFLLAKQQADFVKCIPEYANSIEQLSIEEHGERARIVNLLNENMVVGYNQCIADIKSKLNKTNE